MGDEPQLIEPKKAITTTHIDTIKESTPSVEKELTSTSLKNSSSQNLSAASKIVGEKGERPKTAIVGSYIDTPSDKDYANTYIFSISGAPSRRVRRQPRNANATNPTDNNEHHPQCPEGTVSRPVSGFRNPLTGSGVNSTDEHSYRPKGRISKQQESPAAVVPSRTEVQSNQELKRLPTSTSSTRNPLTGYGLNSHDELNHKPNGRRDGNPLLGIGYDSKRLITDPVPSDKIHPAGYVRKGVAQTPNNRRVPPGGYSTRLW